MSTEKKTPQHPLRPGISEEERRIRNQIKKGILPAYSLAKMSNDDTQCEALARKEGGKRAFKRNAKGEFVPRLKRTWRQVSTLHALLGKPGAK